MGWFLLQRWLSNPTPVEVFGLRLVALAWHNTLPLIYLIGNLVRVYKFSPSKFLSAEVLSDKLFPLFFLHPGSSMETDTTWPGWYEWLIQSLACTWLQTEYVWGWRSVLETRKCRKCALKFLMDLWYPHTPYSLICSWNYDVKFCSLNVFLVLMYRFKQ